MSARVVISFRFRHYGGQWIAVCAIAVIAVLNMAAATYDVGVFDYFYEPFEISIHTGDTIVWTANGFDHTVISDTDIFNSFVVWPTAIPVLRSFKYTFHEAGTFPYYCADHGGPEGNGMSGTVFVTGTTTNQVPRTPTNSFPISGATNQPIRLEMRANVFADPDGGDLHAASQWIIHRVTDSQLVYDSGEVIDNGASFDSKTNRFIPDGLLQFGTSYSWQVRYKDSYGDWSADSAATTFSTVAPSLRAFRDSAVIVLAWPTNSVGFVLEYCTNTTVATWSAVSPAPQALGANNVVTNQSTNGERKFYRLKKS